ncbi:hypothetical protein SSS_10611, partial [Sarcoptes scabiei]
FFWPVSISVMTSVMNFSSVSALSSDSGTTSLISDTDSSGLDSSFAFVSCSIGVSASTPCFGFFFFTIFFLPVSISVTTSVMNSSLVSSLSSDSGTTSLISGLDSSGFF